VAHAGVVGWSAAGLALLAAGSPALDVELVGAYLHPSSPLAAGPAAAEAGATAMMDVSDGLLRDAGRIARAGGVVLDLEAPETAFRDDLERLGPIAGALGASAARWVLDGGEDHGLLATFPPSVTLPPGFRAIGRVRAGSPEVLVDGSPASPTSGWDHFGGR
jgi:thiamine-monophosphate kinase